MLINDFFFLSDLKKESDSIQASIKINEHHKIFNGHFPGQPIVPGVCMLQMTKEILEDVLKYKIQLHTAEHLKFLAFINPKENNSINIEIQFTRSENNTIKVTSSLYNAETVFFKFKGLFAKKANPVFLST